MEHAVEQRTVSVITPTHCKREHLAATLGALGAQTYPLSLVEVIVVDDCSEDDTWDFLTGLKTQYALRPILHEENRGSAAARNTALRAAEGELALFLDDDMRAVPGLIEAHVRCHDEHPGAVVIGNALTAPELGTSNTLRYLDTRGVHKLSEGAAVPARYFVTNNSSVPRRRLLEVGLFDESFVGYGFEDTEIAFRLEEEAGLNFIYCPEALAYHIHHHSLEQLLRKRYESGRALVHLLESHPHRAAELSVDALLPPRADDRPALRARKLAMLALMAPPFVAMARAVAGGPFMGPVTCAAIDYLIADRYRRALAESLRDAA
ncbi:MAG: glycosyltransferase [Candidatus Eisenbacteria bacterium]|nr:glycosyltransferase [Candidatus Eisenbacteria bacterium]